MNSLPTKTILFLSTAFAWPWFCRVAFADPATRPSSAPSTQVGASADQIGLELVSVGAQIQFAGETPEVLSDAIKRSDAAPRLIPLMKKQSMLLDQYIAAKAGTVPPAMFDQMKQYNQAVLYLLGDEKTVADINLAIDAPKESDVSLEAFSTRLLSQWVAAGNDLDGQAKLVDQIEKLDESHPGNDQLAMFTFMLSRDVTSEDLANRLMSIATEKMDNEKSAALKKQVPMVKGYRAALAAAKVRLKDQEKHQITLAGKTVDGQDFTTADWKGKVVLVDFWASWCPPCMAELPNIKSIYSKFHGKGLQILGVSNDYNQSVLTEFLARNEMPWPELFDPASAAAQKWSSITTGYNVYQLPTLFLIDKKGTLRTVDGQTKTDEMISKLLAE